MSLEDYHNLLIKWITSKPIKAVTGLNSVKNLALEVMAFDNRIDFGTAKNYFYKKNPGGREWCGVATIQILLKHRDGLIPVLRDDIELLDRLEKDYVNNQSEIETEPKKKNKLQSPESPKAVSSEQKTSPITTVKSGSYAKWIFANWNELYDPEKHSYFSGAYQIFRRYKPERQDGDNKIDGDQSMSSDDHAVICELLQVDLSNMECMIITAERKIYTGTMFLTVEDTLNSILHRRVSRPGAQRKAPIHQRMLSISLETSPLPWFSAVMIKTGDVSHRPLAAECLLISIPANHEKLYEELNKLKEVHREDEVIEVSSEIAQYLTDTPPAVLYDPLDPECSRVRLIRDFPELQFLANQGRDGIPYFREPSRTLEGLMIRQLSKRFKKKLAVFRQDYKTST